jgi:hypothetical protein
VIALTAFLFSDRFYNMIRGKSSYILQKTEQTVGFADGNASVLTEGEWLLRCSQDGLQAIDEKGRVEWDVPFTMSSPYMLKAGKFISVADRLGTSVIVVRDGVIETEIDAEKQILLHCVNDFGLIVFCDFVNKRKSIGQLFDGFLTVFVDFIGDAHLLI